MGNLRCMDLLADAGASFDHPNKRGATPFLSAVINCRAGVVDFLMKRNVDVNISDAVSNGVALSSEPWLSQLGNTALHLAVECGYSRVVQQLLDANVTLGATNAVTMTLHRCLPPPGTQTPAQAGQKAEEMGADPELGNLIKSYAELAQVVS
jgi:ankyrin repeat protein